MPLVSPICYTLTPGAIPPEGLPQDGTPIPIDPKYTDGALIGWGAYNCGPANPTDVGLTCPSGTDKPVTWTSKHGNVRMVSCADAFRQSHPPACPIHQISSSLSVHVRLLAQKYAMANRLTDASLADGLGDIDCASDEGGTQQRVENI